MGELPRRNGHALCGGLNQRLPDGYVAKIETRVTFVSQVPDTHGSRRPDRTRAGLTTSRRFHIATNDAGVATIEPISIPLAMSEVEIRDRWIEILKLPEMEVVTVIEILSPSNKAGSGRREYLTKRAALIDRPVNFVEIDLLLGGRRMPMARPLPAGDYYAVVGRTTGTAQCPGLRLDDQRRAAGHSHPAPRTRSGFHAQLARSLRFDL